MKKLITRFIQEERGATMVEYGIMVALIAVVSITIISLLGDRVAAGFDAVDDSLAAQGLSAPD